MFTLMPAVRLSMGAAVLLLAGGCASNAQRANSLNDRSSGVIIEGSELRGANGRLLDGLRGRVTTMQVSRPPAGGCPQVVLRGSRTINGSSRPEVYVDGTRMMDTCILDQIRTAEVKRVEIYSGGLGGSANYPSNANGLIVVFLVDGSG